MSISIRPATPADLPLIGAFIRELAEYEKLAHEVRFDEAVLGAKLFGPRPYAEVVIGEVDGAAQGFALFFHNFSTFEGRPGVYLEDLFVRPAARGAGSATASVWNGGFSTGTNRPSGSTRRWARGPWTNGP